MVVFDDVWIARQRILAWAAFGAGFGLLLYHYQRQIAGHFPNEYNVTTTLSPVISLFVLGLVILCHRSSKNFVRRIYNNYQLRPFPFTYIEGILTFLVWAVLAWLLAVWCANGKLVFGHYAISILKALCVWGLLWITITMTGILIDSIHAKAKTEKQEEQKENSFYYSDEPIKSASQDKLNRAPFAANVAERIVKLPFDEAFVFSIQGSWGEGKTSVMNLLAERLKEEKGILVVRYDPWYFSDEKALINDFYAGLNETINKRYFLPDLKSALWRYRDILRAGFKRLGLPLDLTDGQADLLGLRERIEAVVRSLDKRIVVLVDDVDRMDKPEILAVFRLLKLQAGFNRLVFVIAVDKNVIREHGIPETYIEKIVQEPLHIPAADSKHLDKFLLYSELSKGQVSAIDWVLQRIGVGAQELRDFHAEFDDIYESHIKKILGTLRSIKRYLNGLGTTLPQAYPEVNLTDFLILEVIRIEFENVYMDIQEQPWFYMPAWSLLMPASPLSIFDDKEKQDLIKKHLDGLCKDATRLEIVQSLLRALFYQVDQALGGRAATPNEWTLRQEQRIAHIDSFPKYFMLQVPENDIPDQVVRDIISKWNTSKRLDKDVRAAIDEARGYPQGLSQLFEKLGIFISDLQDDAAVELISVLTRASTTLSKEGWSDRGSELDACRGLILKILDKGLDATKVTDCLNFVIDEGEPVLSVQTLHHISEGSAWLSVKGKVEIDKLTRRLSGRLKKHYKSKDIFSIEGDAAGYMLGQWSKLSEDDRKFVAEYFFELADKNPHYLGKLIEGSVLKWPDTPWQIDLTFLHMMFDADRLFKCVEKAQSEPYKTADQQKSVDLFNRAYNDLTRGKGKISNPEQ